MGTNDLDSRQDNAQKTGRIPMPEQPPKIRARNFLEVPLGYTPDMARQEASRCIGCRKPLCVTGCPVNVNIPAFLKLIADGNFAAAARKIKETNALPAVCGRVCPQESQCESKCILGKKFAPVAIGRCERFAADFERANHLIEIPPIPPQNGKKIAVIGAGPSGITVAGDLTLLGYEVTVFEAFHKPGGVLMYGIPEFRLPKDIVEQEIDYIRQIGVKIELNQVVGRIVTIDELLTKNGFDAVFIGVGAGLPMFLEIPGEDFNGIYSANEYLTRSNLMKAYKFPDYDTPVVRGKNVCVIGGGNVAMDAARTALRLGAESVKIVYRRSRNELPARAEEIHHAEEEGVEFQLLTNPKAYLDHQSQVRAMRCVRMTLGEPDASGRRRPVEVPDSEFEIETDCVIVAAGALANPLLTKNTPQLELNKWGYIVADETTGRTGKPRVWAGGDIVTGSATVILAMGAGRAAAKDIHEFLEKV
ncbi:MAG: NADPH-dependent glutamate synthase [Planctomycetaceae bacterium]|jgi:glutamate synthase (NADPH/NADH) small chain|nr:NADPH-dependent glutamate synthase [Planctomycetaceae bacterium]